MLLEARYVHQEYLTRRLPAWVAAPLTRTNPSAGGTVATSDPQVDSWREEFESLVQKVDGWFRQATKRFQRPSDRGCRMVAFYLMAFRHPVKDERPDTRKQAITHGKQFLKYIAPERREIEAMLTLASRGRPFGNWIERDREILLHMDEARRHIEALLPALSPHRDAKVDPIRKIASCAQEAWAETNGERAPHSTNPDDPLCRFLVPALEAVELMRAREEKTNQSTALAIRETGLSKAWVLERLRENVERSMQAKPVLDKEGQPTGEYRYEGAVANRALELLGKELGMFIDRSHLDVSFEQRLATMTPEQRMELARDMAVRLKEQVARYREIEGQASEVTPDESEDQANDLDRPRD